MTYRVSPIWGAPKSRGKAKRAPVDLVEPGPLDYSRINDPQEKKYNEAMLVSASLLSQFLRAEETRERIKLSDKLRLHERYLKVRWRLMFPDIADLDPNQDEDIFPVGTIYDRDEAIDSIIMAQLKENFGHLPLLEGIALMDLLLQHEVEQAAATDDQAHFLTHTRRICIWAEVIETLLAGCRSQRGLSPSRQAR
jgi:hypothetical protein